MTDSPPSVDPQRHASSPSSASASNGAEPSRADSKTTEILKAATASMPSTVHAAPASSLPPSSADPSLPLGEERARHRSSRSASHRDEGTVHAVRSLIISIEHLLKEISRGAAARFDGVTDELAKARKALDQGPRSPVASAPGGHAGRPMPIAASAQGRSESGGTAHERAASPRSGSSGRSSPPAST